MKTVKTGSPSSPSCVVGVGESSDVGATLYVTELKFLSSLFDDVILTSLLLSCRWVGIKVCSSNLQKNIIRLYSCTTFSVQRSVGQVRLAQVRLGQQPSDKDYFCRNFILCADSAATCGGWLQVALNHLIVFCKGANLYGTCESAFTYRCLNNSDVSKPSYKMSGRCVKLFLRSKTLSQILAYLYVLSVTYSRV